MPASPERWEPLLERHAALAALILVLVATCRIVLTYPVLSHTFDEPAHIAAGMEWLEKHRYTYEPQHPPLARVMTALLPWLAGARGAGRPSIWDEGFAILLSGGGPDGVTRVLSLARAGVLPFFWLTCAVTFAMARWIAGSGLAGALAVFLVTLTPTVLAHAGLATTDMALTGTLLWASYAAWRWWDQPSGVRGVVFGVACALATLVKFSSIPFLAMILLCSALAVTIIERVSWQRWRRAPGSRLREMRLAVSIFALLVWAGYGFEIGKGRGSMTIPVPTLADGIGDVISHNAGGHGGYLLGRISPEGSPFFFLVAVGVKTPLPLLFGGLAGLLILARRSWCGVRAWLPFSVIAGILVFSSFVSRIQLGSRHVLPVFVALAVIAACWLVAWQRRTVSRIPAIAAILMVLSMIPLSLAAHPDYLAYFNVFAGSRPERVLVDSDLDWGQDVKRLAARLRQLGATEVAFTPWATGDLTALYGMPSMQPIDPAGPRPGWNAVSTSRWKLRSPERDVLARSGDEMLWPAQLTPAERIGGILLFYRPPDPLKDDKTGR